MPFTAALPHLDEIDTRRLTQALESLDNWLKEHPAPAGKVTEEWVRDLAPEFCKFRNALRKAGVDRQVFDPARWTNQTSGEVLLLLLLQNEDGDRGLPGIVDMLNAPPTLCLSHLPPAVSCFHRALTERLFDAAAEAPVEWSRPETVQTWAKVFTVHRNTMTKRLKEQKPRKQNMGRLYMLALNDLPAAVQHRYRALRGG